VEIGRSGSARRRGSYHRPAAPVDADPSAAAAAAAPIRPPAHGLARRGRSARRPGPLRGAGERATQGS